MICIIGIIAPKQQLAVHRLLTCSPENSSAVHGVNKRLILISEACPVDASRHDPLPQGVVALSAETAARGEALGDDLGAVTGTSLDKCVELDALASSRLHI